LPFYHTQHTRQVYERKHANIHPPKCEKLHSDRPQTERFPTFQYCQVVNCQLLRLLSMNILVHYSLAENQNIIKVSKIVHHWSLLLNPFCFCETQSLHFTTRVSTTVRFLHSWAVGASIKYKFRAPNDSQSVSPTPVRVAGGSWGVGPHSVVLHCSARWNRAFLAPPC